MNYELLRRICYSSLIALGFMVCRTYIYKVLPLSRIEPQTLSRLSYQYVVSWFMATEKQRPCHLAKTKLTIRLFHKFFDSVH